MQPEAEIVEWGAYYEKNGRFPVEVFMGCKSLSESLRDKSIMAELLKETDFIPKTIKVTQENPRYEEVEQLIGFPCWIRATEGTGGLGSLRLDNLDSYKSWLFINSFISEFTVSEFLTGRHLANQMLYYNDEYVKGAALECAEYVMASTAPSHVTGNTHFARFLNEDRINRFCDDCVKFLCAKLQVPAHGILSFDLKEDKNGDLKVTEVNIRHMAYTKQYYYQADEIVFAFEGAFDYLKKKGWTKETDGKIDMKHVHYVNNGIDLKQFEADKAQFPREDADINEKDVHKIVYLGAVNRANNVKMLIEAAALLKDNPKYRFFIYGDGAYRDELEAYAQSHGLGNVVFKERLVSFAECAWIVSQATVNVMNYEKVAFGISGA